MTILEDIQSNTSKFNISFHLREFVAEAMIQVFMFKPNKDQIEDVMKAKIEPSGMKSFLIAEMFKDMVDAYLAQPFGDEEYGGDTE